MHTVLRGALFGGLAGGSVAAVRAKPAPTSSSEPPTSKAGAVAKGAVSGALGGSLLGLVIGKRRQARAADRAAELADQGVASTKRLARKAKPVLADAVHSSRQAAHLALAEIQTAARPAVDSAVAAARNRAESLAA